jgi:multisubunit Na+/H+ antiporter MnhE subunit
MKFWIGLIVIWLLIYNDAQLFRALHSAIVGVLQ